jgi:hypothetical protein
MMFALPRKRLTLLLNSRCPERLRLQSDEWAVHGDMLPPTEFESSDCKA